MERIQNRLLGPLAILIALSITACGTTSSLQSASDAQNKIDLSSYDRVVVRTLENNATPEKTFRGRKADQKRQEHGDDVAGAARTFSTMIASELRATERFSSVELGDADAAGALIIDGEVTRFERGSAVARALIGLGAGSSYFDAVVKISDAETGAEIGTIVVDKNSWVLGGAIAAGQSVDAFMREGARKVAKELSAARGSATKVSEL